MDFSLLKEAMASKSYGKIADICDELMLQVAAEGVSFQEDWPYAIHLLGHIYANDVNSARFLWKSIPLAIKESNPEVIAAWKIGQQQWMRDYAGVHEAIRGFDWSPEAQGLVTAFSGSLSRALHQEDVPAITVCIFDNKCRRHSSLSGNERGSCHQLCSTRRLDSRPCNWNADREEATDCDGTEVRSQ